MEVVNSNIEGEVDMSPGARNNVNESGAIKAINPGAMGSFPITKEMLEFQQEIIHKAFFKESETDFTFSIPGNSNSIAAAGIFVGYASLS